MQSAPGDAVDRLPPTATRLVDDDGLAAFHLGTKPGADEIESAGL